MYIVVLQLLTAAIDCDFQSKTAEIARATGGRCRSPPPPPKNFERMQGKLFRDHKDEEMPKPAANIDLSRNAIAFSTTADFIKGYEAMTKRFPPLRVKNGYRKDNDAAKTSYGYRALLANMLYKPDPNPDGSPVTWGQLFDLERTQLEWEKIRDHFVCLGGMYNKVLFEPAVRTVKAVFPKKPVSFIVETQFMMQQYLDMRKESHLFYKIIRAETFHSLQQDFRKHAILR